MKVALVFLALMGCQALATHKIPLSRIRTARRTLADFNLSLAALDKKYNGNLKDDDPYEILNNYLDVRAISFFKKLCCNTAVQNSISRLNTTDQLRSDLLARPSR